MPVKQNPMENQSFSTPTLSRLISSPHEQALFLDIDGTLLDIAAKPDEIFVPDDLLSDLEAVSLRLDGALALVTGRSIDFVDALFYPLTLPVAGLHGVERRDPDGKIHSVEMPHGFKQLKDELRQQAQERWPDIIIEDKGAAIAVHYRQAPSLAPELAVFMRDYRERAGDGFVVQGGKMVFEIRPSNSDKGAAVKAFLSQIPFKGRLPVTVGDDLTDESMFAAANDLRGLSIRVGTPLETSKAVHTIASPGALRDMLRVIAERP